MKLYVYEGTPSEISDVMERLQIDVQQVLKKSAEAPAADIVAPKLEFVSVDFARRVLNRLSLPLPIKRILIAIYKSDKKRVSSTRLIEAAGITASEYAGSKGAFQRRISHTEGYATTMRFFDTKWNHDAGENTYRLPETVREAMEIEGVLGKGNSA